MLKPRRQKRGEIGRNGVVSNDGLRLDAFCSACTHVSVLFGCLGFAFKFAEMEYVSKVRDLVEASKTFDTFRPGYVT